MNGTAMETACVVRRRKRRGTIETVETMRQGVRALLTALKRSTLGAGPDVPRTRARLLAAPCVDLLMKGEPSTRKPGPWALPRQAGVLLGLMVLLLSPPPARAESGDTTVSVETTVGKDLRAWSLLGDVELRDGATFLTLGYTGARPEAGTALTHQLSLGA